MISITFVHRVLRSVLLAIPLVALAGAAVAQESMRWGGVPDELFEMQVYEPDSTAGAVILGDIGSVHYLENMSLIFEHHRRVKVFSEAGYEMATVELVYHHGGRAQQIRRVEGQTFVRDASGQVRRVTLASSDVAEEEDGNITRVRFTMPALEPGAIFEYRYRIESRDPSMIPDWYFQDVEPTLYSEFKAEIPTFLTVNRHPIGRPNFAVQEIQERPFSASNFRGRYGGGGGVARIRENSEYRWVMRDVPAFRDEDFVASIVNHAYAMRFQVAGYHNPQRGYVSLSNTWAEVARQLIDHSDLGRRMRPSRSLRRQAAEITEGAENSLESMNRIYDYVRQTMVWDERYRFTTRRSLDRVLESRRGSSGEINMLLIALMRAADIEANPVLSSTRRNGYVHAFWVSTSQFNHLLALAEIDGEEYFMDATDPHRPVGMLPLAALNHQGLLLAEDRIRWATIEPAGRTLGALTVNATVDASGAVGGVIEGNLSGYSALELRRRLAASTDQAEHGRLAARNDALTYQQVSIEGLEGDGAVSYRMDFNAGDHATPMAHLLTFNPVLLGRMERSPFRQEERTYPVDFTYPRINSYVGTFAIPEGYSVDELPSRVEFAMPGGGAAFSRTVSEIDGSVRIQRQYVLNQVIFQPEQYQHLRAFFDRITAADAEMVVLVRNDAVAEPAPLAADGTEALEGPEAADDAGATIDEDRR
jgi:transglutaminase-like putative cysteine protease